MSFPSLCLVLLGLTKRLTDDNTTALGIERPQETWAKTLTRFNPFARKEKSPRRGQGGRRGDEPFLPHVKPDLVPRSWDPVAERMVGLEAVAEDEEDIGDVDMLD